MKIIVACEESQTACKAFRPKGHNMYPCKLHVGDSVTHRKDLSGLTQSVVIAIEKRFTSDDGAVTNERDITNICLPYTYDGNIVVIDYPEQTLGGFIRKAFQKTYVWTGYTVHTTNEKINAIYSDKSLKLKSTKKAK